MDAGAEKGAVLQDSRLSVVVVVVPVVLVVVVPVVVVVLVLASQSYCIIN